MFLAIKDTKIIDIHEVEWQCRRNAKGLDKSDYWTWLESITTEGVPEYYHKLRRYSLPSQVGCL